MSNASIALTDHLVISFQINKILAKTNPKKKDQTKMGWLSKRCVIIFEKVKILIAIPNNNASKKLPLIAAQVAFKPFCLTPFSAEKLILLILSINS